MIRRRHISYSARKRLSSLVKKTLANRTNSQRQFWVERLEDRYLLSANSPQTDAFGLNLPQLIDGPVPASTSVASGSNAPAAPVYEMAAPPPPTQDNQVLGSGSLLATAPFPLEQTFLLHSLPG